jgi:hypothetical protein
MAMKTFRFIDEKKMVPRAGNKFSTTYYRQTYHQRQAMVEWLEHKISELLIEIARHPKLSQASNWPLQGFPKTQGQKNRSLLEIIGDMLDEIQGIKKNGKPKDIAKAPVDRWNKFFESSEWEFAIEFGTSTEQGNSFNNLFKLRA